jgi:hypothetical protein
MSPVRPSPSACRLLVCLLCLGLAPAPGHAIDLLPDFLFGGGGDDTGKDGRPLWEAGNEYIRVIPREEGAPPNQHPVTLSVAELTAALSALQYNRDPGLLERVGAVPLFVPSQVSNLANVLARGMPTLTPDEEIAFALIGLHQGTFAKERMAIAGRIFHADNRLNIVLGDVHKEMRVAANKRVMTTGEMTDDIDLRMEPFRIGRRARERDLKHRVTGPQGLEFATTGRGKPRGDWLRLDLATLAAEATKQQSRLPAGLEEERVRLQREAQQMAVERRQMREEMARMRKELRTGGAGEAGNGSGGGDGGGGSVEQRLKRLESLREKGLVSDDEYSRKRDEILSEL